MKKHKLVFFIVISLVFAISLGVFAKQANAIAWCCEDAQQSLCWDTIQSNCPAPPSVYVTGKSCNELKVSGGDCEDVCCCSGTNPVSPVPIPRFSCRLGGNTEKPASSDCQSVCSNSGNLYTLKGYVIDEDNNKIDKATVTVQGNSKLTTNGFYQFDNLQQRTYTISATKSGCSINSTTVQVPYTDDTFNLTIVCHCTAQWRCDKWGECKPESSGYFQLCEGLGWIDDINCPVPPEKNPPMPAYKQACEPGGGLCGDNKIDPGEECDGTEVGNCGENNCEANCHCKLNLMCYGPPHPPAFHTFDPTPEKENCTSCPEVLGQCPPECSEKAAGVVLNDIQHVQMKPQLGLSWQLLQDCQNNLDYFQIFRCEGSACSDQSYTGFNSLPVLISKDKFTYIDNPDYRNYALKPKTKYCYYVQSVFEDKYYNKSNIKCIETGDRECLQDHPDSWCDGNSKASCNYENKLTLEECGSEQVCAITPGTGAECLNRAACDKCNGMLSMFAVYDINIDYTPVGEDPGTYSCKNELADNFGVCYIDYTKTTADKYYDCANVTSCYDYKSKANCEQDKCNRIGAGECGWTYYNPFLNTGICSPKNETEQQCWLCNNESYQRILPNCTKDICSLYGKCYFSSHSKKCMNKANVSCFEYYTADECIGANRLNVTVDVYSPDPKGTNKILVKSNDALGIGLCKWGKFSTSGPEKCIKDANNDSKADCGADTKCKLDTLPPVTNIFNNTKYGKIIDLTDDLAVQDNKYEIYDIRTSFRILPVNPTTQSSYLRFPLNKIVNIKNIPQYRNYQSGNYVFYYFSNDTSKNLEVVKNFTFRLDATNPTVTFNYEKVPFKINDYESRTNVTITISVNDLPDDDTPFCTGHLQDANPIYDVLDINDSKPNYEIKYTYLEDNYYVYKLNCTDDVGNSNYTEIPIVIDADSTITNPSPQHETFNTDSILINITTQDSVNTYNCKYSAGQMSYTNMENTFDKDSAKTLHSKTLSSLDSKYYIYYTACKFNDGKVTEGNLGDRIIFAVDKLAPVTTPRVYPSGEEYTENNEWTDTLALSLDCNDTDDRLLRPLLNGEKEDMSFGCDTTMYCVVKSTEPPIEEPVVDEQGGSTLCTFQKYENVLDFNENNKNSILYFYSNDTGNNRGAVKHVVLKVKNLLFEEPDIEVISP